MNGSDASPRAAELASRLRAAFSALVELVEGTDGQAWRHIPAPGVWSAGKDAEHLAEGHVYHQWIVRMTIGERVSSRRPRTERAALTTTLSPGEMVELLRQRADEGASLVGQLTDEQLDRPTRPPRAGDERLAQTIERVMIGHVHGHRREIEAKVRQQLSS